MLMEKLKSVDIINSEGKIINIECDSLSIWRMESKYSYKLSYRSKPEWNSKILALHLKNNISTYLEAAGSANGKFTLNGVLMTLKLKL